MRATLSFNLPDEQETYDIHVKAMDMSIAVEEFGNYLRSEYKYKEHTEEVAKFLEEVREKWFEVMGEVLT